jgi:flavin-dependent dehydrogenase
MMAGDAARLCTPTVSAGIANALFSGRWAGEHWAEPSKYEQALKARLYGNLTRGYEFKVGHLADEAIDTVFRRRLRPMIWLHKFLPGYVEKRTLDLLGW